jgi:hypothetical protein
VAKNCSGGELHIGTPGVVYEHFSEPISAPKDIKWSNTRKHEALTFVNRGGALVEKKKYGIRAYGSDFKLYWSIPVGPGKITSRVSQRFWQTVAVNLLGTVLLKLGDNYTGYRSF